ncbi:unnamed protein product, partial [Rotaria magnacalcarata]
MALESYLDIKNLNSKVTVIGSNPVRRELVFGFEDGSVQTYDPETAIGTPIDKLNIGSVAYSICFHSRLKQVIFGIPE